LRPAGLPLEELMFGAAFGMYWSSGYEHLTWRQHVKRQLRDVSSNRSSAR